MTACPNRTFFASLTFLALLASSCDSDPALCERAREHVRECFGSELEACNEAQATELLESSCDELLAQGEAGKADGTCPSFLWFMCAPPVTSTCPEAGDRTSYDTFSSEQRMRYHWQWGECTAYGADLPGLTRSRWDLLLNVARGAATSVTKLGRAFTNATDELDEGRVKLLHPYGSLAQLELVRDDSAPSPDCDVAYTGIWTESRVPALARLSWAAEPEQAGYIPGLALKFFIEGRASVNLHAINGLDGDPNRPNFFVPELTNVLPMPTAKSVQVLLEYFLLFADDPLHLRLDHTARWTSDGARVPDDEVVAPYQFFLRPTEEARSHYAAQLDADPSMDFRDALSTMPIGMPLYTVVLTAEKGGCEQTFGTLVTTSEIVASQWGDLRLHFPHATEEQGF